MPNIRKMVYQLRRWEEVAEHQEIRPRLAILNLMPKHSV